MNNFTQRTISAIVYVAIIALCLLMGKWPAFGLFFLLSALCMYEYIQILLKDSSFLQKAFFLLAGLYIYSILCLWQFQYLRHVYYGVILVLTVSLFIAELFHKRPNPFDNIGRQITGWLYIPVSLGLFYGIGFQEFLYQQGEIVYNGPLVLGVLILIWSNDTFAYLTGRWIGKTPLFSRISPKKTIEGSLGGLLLTIGVSIALYYWKPVFSLTETVLFAVIICISATLGDLIESMLKRSMEIKDSGSLIPGHGGFLDRLDASLITAWIVTFFLQLI